MTIFAFLFVLSILILIHEFGHFLTARKLGVRIERFSLGFGPVVFSLMGKETEYCLSLIPLGGYVKMAGENPREELRGESWEYRSQPIRNRFLIVLTGPLLNYLLGFFLFWLVFSTGYPTVTSRVGELLKDYPAEKAGIEKGDLILKIDQKSVKNWEELTEIIHQSRKESLDLLLKREDRIFLVTVFPRRETYTDLLGRKREISLIGIKPSEEFIKVKYPFLESGLLAGKKVFFLTRLTFLALARIISGHLSLRDSVSGPLGIFFITRWAAELGISTFLNLLAVLSVSLALFNILPIPVLDGGHFLFLFIEKIRKKPLSVKTQERITQMGMTFLILLMIFVFYNDLLRFQVIEKIIHFWRK
ncbi:MAG: RIP metalloprotease RseP [Candidatus Omnitrophica bacterium]|nr:RIP metalloprotease RseP [Candidatus Omnitrophota bacterium]MCM8793308.1 RIP metalloprotease RseP [Candidatus Omnitrophota bacterium]